MSNYSLTWEDASQLLKAHAAECVTDDVSLTPAEHADIEAMDRVTRAHALVIALFWGDYHMAQALWLGIQDCVIHLEADGNQLKATLVSGESFDVDMKLLEKYQAHDLLDEEFQNGVHLELVTLVSGGADLQSDSPWGLVLEGRHEIGYDHSGNYKVGKEGLELPILSGDHLYQPELQAAMMRRRQRNGITPSWIQDTLCWASAEMVAAHPDSLFAMAPVVSLHQETADKVGGEINVRSSSGLAVRGPVVVGEHVEAIQEANVIRYGFTGYNGYIPGIRDHRLIRCFMPNYLHAAATCEPGFLLCRTTVDFLAGFSQEKEQCGMVYDKALNDYIPISLMAINAAEARGRVLAAEQNTEYTPDESLSMVVKPVRAEIGEFMEMLNEPAEVAAFQKLMTPEHRQLLLRSFTGKSVSAETMHVLRDVLHLDFVPEKLGFDSSTSEISNMVAQGIRIPAGTQVFLAGRPAMDSMMPKQISQLLGQADGVISICGLPSNADAPAIFEKMKQEELLGLDGMNWPLREMARRHSFDEFLPLLKSKGAWRMAFEVWGADPLAPHIHKVPEDVQTRMASSSFDI
ncbi:hypothetical protein HNP46_006338 [Pseudomonas nitritireducens]|uniref:Uncharacterized protein n=1 Tax=Pseudomonas nitroreducens TaxID=46680 RepID=A0A7W7P580_PSENT|nr:hypothetical protein [Pseudomonas nitritireducens]MBB4867425.1 hypothetical protein [Pseudomonas nitritireducens]